MSPTVKPTSPSELRVVTPAAWLAEDLARGTKHGRPWDPATEPHPGGLAVVHHLGLWAPPSTEGIAWWMPGAHAQRLRASGLDPVLLTPGPRAITAFDGRFLRRRVEVMPLREAKQRTDLAFHRPIFAKPADIKRETVPARVWPTLEHFIRAAERGRLTEEAPVLISDPIEFVREVRMHILDGKVVAASTYLNRGRTWDAMVPEEALDVGDDVRGFVEAAVATASAPLPRGFVIDVGHDEYMDWCIVETNPAWSSNPYWATEDHAAEVVQTILASQDPDSPGETWNQDDSLVVRAKALPVRPLG